MNNSDIQLINNMIYAKNLDKSKIQFYVLYYQNQNSNIYTDIQNKQTLIQNEKDYYEILSQIIPEDNLTKLDQIGNDINNYGITILLQKEKEYIAISNNIKQVSENIVKLTNLAKTNNTLIKDKEPGTTSTPGGKIWQEMEQLANYKSTRRTLKDDIDNLEVKIDVSKNIIANMGLNYDIWKIDNNHYKQLNKENKAKRFTFNQN